MDGHANPSTCFLGDSNKNYHKASTVYAYDPKKAIQLLAKNGITDLTINFAADTNCWAFKFKDIIVENLEAVGITCNVTETAFRWTDLDEKLKNIDFDMCMTTIERSLHGANADFLLHYIYYQGPYMDTRTEYPSAEGSRFNEIKDLTDKAAEITGTEQQQIYNQIFDILADEVFLYPFIHREQITGSNSRKISGFSPISTGGIYVLGTELN